MSNIKQAFDPNEYIPPTPTGLSIFPNNTKRFDEKQSLPHLNNQRMANSNKQQINTNNGSMVTGGDSKGASSQIFFPETRSFSLDLSNLSSLNDTDETNNLSQTSIFNPTFTQHGFTSTDVLSSKQFGNSNTDLDATSAMLGDLATSIGDEDSNSDSALFSPRTFLSRPSSISSSSLNEIVDEVSKSKRIGKERRRRVKKVKASHNDIERKYRLSINDKIVQLRNLVPTIRYGFKELSNIPLDQSDIDALDGLEPTKKLNKGTILNKTIEYIKHLELKCEQYKILNAELNSRLTNSQPVTVLPASMSSSTSSSVMSSTVVTPSVKMETHLPTIPMQQESNLNILQNSYMGDFQLMANNNNNKNKNNISNNTSNNKHEESFSPLAKVFIENDLNNGDNNLFKFESFT